jgi:hypothetical protein
LPLLQAHSSGEWLLFSPWGKPVLIEGTFPPKCPVAEFEGFSDRPGEQN